jgi:hypothetical protein
VRELGVDATRIYAATEHTLVVLYTNTYEGYSNNTIPVMENVDFRMALPSQVLQHVPLSGLAVGPARVYLSLQDQPYLISIAKPNL